MLCNAAADVPGNILIFGGNPMFTLPIKAIWKFQIFKEKYFVLYRLSAVGFSRAHRAAAESHISARRLTAGFCGRRAAAVRGARVRIDFEFSGT